MVRKRITIQDQLHRRRTGIFGKDLKGNEGSKQEASNGRAIQPSSDLPFYGCPTPHNAMLGQNYLNKMRIVPSTYHQLLRYVIPDGIKKSRKTKRGHTDALLKQEYDSE
ncbi:hypothetical protein D8674_033770 [Pyrus ussuriensis x Pyrus communis]|uniref:Uncharacterized protein n=1 Tax=Pyrus ussuriensis x Pyrus communis TaxID=2448454 RepID=A0A5N5HMC4_9ROSA|nr:hypothetical protein D8674_033770 [Pyrus ussuriensis x Pyrus communis]